MQITGDICAPGAITRAARGVGSRGVTLIHGNAARARLLVNLHAQLSAVNVLGGILLLAFRKLLCKRLALAGSSISCVTCSSGPFAHDTHELHLNTWRDAGKYSLDDKALAWFQRLYVMRVFTEHNVDVLALDSDMAIRVDPRIIFRDASFGKGLLLAYDHNVGFAHVNIGCMYICRASPNGTTVGLLRAVERRVLSVLALPPPASRRDFAWRVGELWDQNVFNKVPTPRHIMQHTFSSAI